MNDIDILKSSLSGEDLAKALEQYEKGRPAAYILGEWEFFGYPFKVNENCLIPRLDTERTVEKAIELIPQNSTFADLCTGSGAIGISILKRRPDLKCTAVDISKEALETAKENAQLNNVSDRMSFIEADVKNKSFANTFPKVSCIVSNPPYISKHDMENLDKWVQKEPSLALYGGIDGLDFYRDIAENFDCNMFIFEIGYDQKEALFSISQKHGFECTVYKDYSGKNRVALLKK